MTGGPADEKARFRTGMEEARRRAAEAKTEAERDSWDEIARGWEALLRKAEGKSGKTTG